MYKVGFVNSDYQNKVIAFNNNEKISDKTDNKNSINTNDNIDKFKKTTEKRKVTFTEGAKLIAKGFVNQACNIAKGIINNPIKTISAVAVTTGALMALPFIGIPTAVGGAILGLAYAGIALGKTIYQSAQFIKNNREGNYEKAKNNLERIGQNTLDIAISVPFVPKGIKAIKRFTKYGKIKINNYAISDFKNAKGIKNKFNAIKKAGTDIDKSINFAETTEKELSKINFLTDKERIRIKQYIEKYNVPREKIIDVALEQWAKENGIHTKPKWSYKPTRKNVNGLANSNNGEIIIKDPSKPDLKNADTTISPEWEQVSYKNLDNNWYEIKYKNVKNGSFKKELLNKKVANLHASVNKTKSSLSPEAKEISTAIHERTHIDQFAKMKQIYKDKFITTPEASEMYAKMNAERGPLSPTQIEKYKKMNAYKSGNTAVSYQMSPYEIEARLAEIQLHAKPEFKTLDNVFKTTKKMPLPNNYKEIILNNIRSVSASKENNL